MNNPNNYAKILKYCKETFAKLPTDIQQHSIRVATYSEILFQRVVSMNVYPLETDLSNDKATFNKEACLYHDIGKAKLSAEALADQSSFEYKYHPDLSAETIELDLQNLRNDTRTISTLEMALDIAHNHHENWDGTGFPNGWSEGVIPVTARICSIVNFYDEITGCKKDPLGNSHNYACLEIAKRAGTMFDPVIVSVFSHYQEDIRTSYDSFFQKMDTSIKKISAVKQKPKKIKWPVELSYLPIFNVETKLPEYFDAKLILVDEKLGYVTPKDYWDIAVKSTRASKLVKVETKIICEKHQKLKNFPEYLYYMIKLPRTSLFEGNLAKLQKNFQKANINKICFAFNKLDNLIEEDFDVINSAGFESIYEVQDETLSEVIEIISKHPYSLIKIPINLIINNNDERKESLIKALKIIADDLQVKLVIGDIYDKAQGRMMIEMGFKYLTGEAYGKPKKQLTNKYATTIIKIGGDKGAKRKTPTRQPA